MHRIWCCSGVPLDTRPSGLPPAATNSAPSGLAPAATIDLVDVFAQTAAAIGMAKFAQRFRFNLPNALAGDAE